jgi:PAS domain S-box-containing protein
VIARPELPENAQTLFRAVAAVADALYVVDAAGRITFLNPAALKILGYADEDELLGSISHETIHYLRPDGSSFPLLRPRLTGETVHLDLDWFVRKDTTKLRRALADLTRPTAARLRPPAGPGLLPVPGAGAPASVFHRREPRL